MAGVEHAEVEDAQVEDAQVEDAQVEDAKVEDAQSRAPVRVRGRFSRLPDRISPDDMVESVPEPPPAESGFDANADAVRRFGIPL